MKPKYSGFEIIRFPLLFGGFLLAVSTAYFFRHHLIPDFEDERRRKFRGNDENREIIEAIKSMKKTQ